jgi:putative tryptophan/tyrosine transport system substrate-binding protein
MINMSRREFITLLGGLTAAWPLTSHAQQVERVRRVGVLMAGTDDADSHERVVAFRQGLQKVGWSERRNLLITSRWGAGDNDSIRAAASDLVGLKPDVLLVNGHRGLVALQQETPTIPIVFAGRADPVELALLASLARPGSNITGFANLEHSSIDDYVGLLKELAPSLARVAIVMSSGAPDYADRFRISQNTASRFGIKPVVMPVVDAAEIEPAIAAFAREPDGGLLLPADAGITVHCDLIIAMAARYRLPAIYPFRVMATSGGLMSYGADVVHLSRGAASYAGRILKGEKPGELPVQLATKLNLIINLKTAKALGLTAPVQLLARADEVIE